MGYSKLPREQLPKHTNVYETFLSQDYGSDCFQIPSETKVRKIYLLSCTFWTHETVHCLEIAPIEMYLAASLFDFPHWRSTVQRKCSSTAVPSTGPQTCNMATTYILPSVNGFLIRHWMCKVPFDQHQVFLNATS